MSRFRGHVSRRYYTAGVWTWQMRVTNLATGKVISRDDGYLSAAAAGDGARRDIAAAELAHIRGWRKGWLRQ